MKTENKNNYAAETYPAAHTMRIKCSYIDTDLLALEPIVNQWGKRKVTGKNKEEYWLIVNPNATQGSSMHKTFSQFRQEVEEMLLRTGATDVQITRADLSINSDNPNDYEKFKKLHKLLICCIANAYNVTNCYESKNLWTSRSLSVAIKGNTIEAENYNKAEESQGKYDTKNRFEIRSLKIKTELNDIPYEFTEKWFDRLDRALEDFKAVQSRYNYELAKNWLEDKAKTKKYRDYLSLNAFLLQFKDNIFTRKQLVELLIAIEVEKPEEVAKRFKDRHHIEFFSETDLKFIIKDMKKKIITYFAN